MSLANEVLKHLLSHFEIRDDAVFHWPDRDDVPGRAAEHVFSFTADCFDLIGNFVDSNDGRFRDDNAASFRVNKRIRGTEVNRKVAGE